MIALHDHLHPQLSRATYKYIGILIGIEKQIDRAKIEMETLRMPANLDIVMTGTPPRRDGETKRQRKSEDSSSEIVGSHNSLTY